MFTCTLAEASQPATATHLLLEDLDQSWGSEAPDVAFLFISLGFGVAGAAGIAREVAQRLGPQTQLIGCTGGGVVGGSRELEHRPGAASLLAGRLSDTRIHRFRLPPGHGEMLATDPSHLLRWSGVEPQERPSFVLLADPFSFQPDPTLRAFNELFPGTPLVGGLASDGAQPGENLLFFGDQVVEDGGVALALAGRRGIQPIVSQGCRPIGRSWVITRTDGPFILELGGRPALEILYETLEHLPPADRSRVRHNLFVGLVVDEYQRAFCQGDFLIRNLISIDAERKALGLGGQPRPGRTIQFQLRDPQAADEELRLLLARHEGELAAHPPDGVLLFSCLGRGRSMFGAADHDSRLLATHTGHAPAAGFFCNGELGPIGSQLFLHGYTTVAGLFVDRT